MFCIPGFRDDKYIVTLWLVAPSSCVVNDISLEPTALVLRVEMEATDYFETSVITVSLSRRSKARYTGCIC